MVEIGGQELDHEMTRGLGKVEAGDVGRVDEHDLPALPDHHVLIGQVGPGHPDLVQPVVPVDVEVPGCPPSPAAIVGALRGLTGR